MCTVWNHIWTHTGFHRYRKCSYTADLYLETSQCHSQTGSRLQSGTTADTDRNIYHTQHFFTHWTIFLLLFTICLRYLSNRHLITCIVLFALPQNVHTCLSSVYLLTLVSQFFSSAMLPALFVHMNLICYLDS